MLQNTPGQYGRYSLGQVLPEGAYVLGEREVRDVIHKKMETYHPQSKMYEYC